MIDKRIKSLRLSASMTQEELASRLGVSAQAVSKWESGGQYAGYSATAGAFCDFRHSHR